MKIRTQVLCCFAAMLALLGGVAGVAITRMQAIEHIAGDLNGRIVDKTRIAANIVELGQQIRSIDGFVLRATAPEQDDLARSLISSRAKALDGQIANFALYAKAPLEQRLLQNLESSRASYARMQQGILATDFETRRGDIEANQAKLDAASAEVQRQALGLSRTAEAQARDGRSQASVITRDARVEVLFVSGLAVAIGAGLVGVLLANVFRPLARITRALIALSQGRLDVSLFASNRGGEIDEMAQALEVFRKNALALQRAHQDTKTAQAQAAALARHDALTGLANRRMLTHSIGEAIARAGQQGSACAVLAVDLDRFKPINDIHGHAAGDKVLCAVAERIEAATGSEGAAARLASDEFALVLTFEPRSDAPRRLAKRILTQIAEPIAIDSGTAAVGASIGIAIWPDDGADAEALLHAADLAMFRAKRDEPGGLRFFEPEMDSQLRARADLETRIRRAVREGNIRPHYQPLVDLRTQTIVGFEILARWYDGDAVRAPGDFIQIADEIGLMPEMTDTVLRQACRDARIWPDDTFLAINVTPAQISDPELPGRVLRLLAEEGFPSNRLEMEITENALIGDVTRARSVMAALRAEGVRISLDDFGTGYSSLHHLRDLRFDKLKIDRSFVQSMLHNEEATKIVETILALGRNLAIKTLAEGIEEHEQMLRLIDHGCDFGQGYHLGKPLSATGASELLRAASQADMTKAA